MIVIITEITKNEESKIVEREIKLNLIETFHYNA